MVVYDHGDYILVKATTDLPPVIEWDMRFWRYLCPSPTGEQVYIRD